MKQILSLALVFRLGTLSLFACINESYERPPAGKPVPLAGFYLPRGTDFARFRHVYEEDLARFYAIWTSRGNIDAYSDYGVRLIYLGRYAEARQVFREIEQRKPGRYATAACLGTAYELLGQNDSALYWIQKAVAINPDSHEASEWLHVNILRAKIGGEALVRSRFLTGSDFGTETVPRTILSEKALRRLGRAINFQLNERVSFIKPEDRIVATLLSDLGSICVLQGDTLLARDLYQMAFRYGNRSPLLQKRLAWLQGVPGDAAARLPLQAPPVMAGAATFDRPFWQYLLLGMSGTGIGLLGFFILRKNG